MEPLKDVLEEQGFKTNGAGDDASEVPAETYQCQICRDAGFVHPRRQDGKPDYGTTIPCRCMENDLARRKARWLLSQCELPPATNSMTFASFKVLPDTEKAYKFARELAEGKAKKDWLTFTADPDKGKTHLAVAIARRWLQRGIAARYAYVPLLLDELRRGFQVQGDNSYDRRFQMFCEVPLLILDDLGAENNTPWVQERLETIVDYRLMHELALVVTTKMGMDELPESISSRLLRRGIVLYIEGEPYSSRFIRDRSE
jgi:DNA replication protein DnaC